MPCPSDSFSVPCKLRNVGAKTRMAHTTAMMLEKYATMVHLRGDGMISGDAPSVMKAEGIVHARH